LGSDAVQSLRICNFALLVVVVVVVADVVVVVAAAVAAAAAAAVAVAAAFSVFSINLRVVLLGQDHLFYNPFTFHF
jgi:hypothetical protein